MAESRSFQLVFGYRRETGDRRNGTAHRFGLAKRFAWILNSYRPDLGPDLYFDAELFQALIRAYLSNVPHDVVEINMPDKARTKHSSFEALDKKPFFSAKISCAGAVVCYMETEFWAKVGGPEPYHDSYTLSVYSRSYDQPSIAAMSQTVAQDLGADLEKTWVGQEALPLSWWRQFLSRLKQNRAPIRIAATSVGIVLRDSEGKEVAVGWGDIKRITVAVRDVYIPSDFRTMIIEWGDGRVLELNEEMTGWVPLAEAIDRYVPGAMPGVRWLVDLHRGAKQPLTIYEKP